MPIKEKYRLSPMYSHLLISDSIASIHIHITSLDKKKKDVPHLLGYRKNCMYPLLGNLLSDLLCHAISNGRTITIIVVGSKVNEYGGVNDGCVWGFLLVANLAQK